MAKKYHQSMKDREDESRGMKKRLGEGKREGVKDYDAMAKSQEGHIESWSDRSYGALKQMTDGSMGYLAAKDRLSREDEARIEHHKLHDDYHN